MDTEKRFAAALAAILAAGSILCGCRHPMADYEAGIISGNYSKAADIAVGEITDGDSDELMWRLMAGGAFRLAGQDEPALDQFDKAEDTMIEHDGASVFSKGATGTWAMLTNEKAFPYDGGGLDRVMTCLYKAIDFAAAGNPAAVRTELNRAALHQQNWLDDRRREIADAQERLDKDAEAYKKEKQSQTPAAGGKASLDSKAVVSGAFANEGFAAQVKSQADFDLATSGLLDNLKSADWMNVYAAHVTGVFRWLNGDDGRSFLKDAASCRPDNVVAVRDVAECEKGVRPKDQVWVWLEEGLGPKRTEWRIDLPLVLIPYVNRFVLYAGMAFPRLDYRAAAGANWQASTSGGSVPLAELMDVDAKAKLEFDVYLRGALTREITRTVVKVGTQVALGVVAENIDDSYTRCALKASQLAAAAWAASTTGADTRSWTTLPKKVHAVRIDRPADGKVALTGTCGKVVEITVPVGNSMVFVSKPSALAPASVKVATYP